MKKEIAKILLELKAVELRPSNPFKWASGILSPIYCDNRLVISNPDKRKIVVDYFVDVIEDNCLDVDVVGGTATAGIPWAAWIAERINKPMIYVRAKAKDHGQENTIEGNFKPGMKVLIIEDLISTGSSLVSAIEAVREAGGIVNEAVAIFTYGLPNAEEKIAQANFRAYTLCDFKTLVETAVEKSYITEEDKKKLLEFIKDPRSWAKRVGLE